MYGTPVDWSTWQMEEAAPVGYIARQQGRDQSEADVWRACGLVDVADGGGSPCGVYSKTARA